MNFEKIKNCPLFDEISYDQLTKLLECMKAKVVRFKKNQTVFLEGDPAKFIGIVLSGSVQVVMEDYFGNRNIIAIIEPGQLFGEAFACAFVDSLPVSVTTICDSEIMLIESERIITQCEKVCGFHNQIIHNLLRIVAEKNLKLNHKIQFTSRRTTKEKLMAFLMYQAKLAKSSSFYISYDRQQLADYLGVERSAMAAELSKLRSEGAIECRKNYFKLL